MGWIQMNVFGLEITKRPCDAICQGMGSEYQSACERADGAPPARTWSNLTNQIARNLAIVLLLRTVLITNSSPAQSSVGKKKKKKKSG